MSAARARRAGPRFALLLLAWVAALIASCLVGSQEASLGAALAGVERDTTILLLLRLPRALLALLAGGLLAGSGLVFQTLFRNPLAEPYTLGVAGGAALGAVLAIRWLGGETVGTIPVIALAAFLGAAGAAAVVVGLALRSGALDRVGLLLAGIAVSFTCGAAILLVQFFAEPYQTFRMIRWTMGGLAVVGYREVAWLAPWMALAGVALRAHRFELDLLLTGEDLAASRGLDLARTRARLVAATSLVVGATVAVCGPIGFVGLVAPHILRRAFGPGHAALGPACLLGGGVFLAAADLAARLVVAPAELPVGVLTAILGGPFFLFVLLLRDPRRA